MPATKLNISVVGIDGRKVHLSVASDKELVRHIIQEYSTLGSSLPSGTTLSYSGRTLDENRRLSDYNIGNNSTLTVMRLRGGACRATFDGHYFALKPTGKPPAARATSAAAQIVRTMHISPKSDCCATDTSSPNFAGVALWKWQGKTDWVLNDVQCQSGYIYVKLSSNIMHIPSGAGQIHGKLFRSLFARDPPYNSQMVATGFSFLNGTWRWNSYLNNCAGTWQDGVRAASSLEQRCIQLAYRKWCQTGVHTHKTSHLRYELLGGTQPASLGRR
eukprot:scpid97488/ scgid27665/ 